MKTILIIITIISIIIAVICYMKLQDCCKKLAIKPPNPSGCTVAQIPLSPNFDSLKRFMQNLDDTSIHHQYRFESGVIVVKDSLKKIIDSTPGQTIRMLVATWDDPSTCTDTTVVVTQSGNSDPQFYVNGSCICMSPCCPTQKGPQPHALCVLKSN